MATRARATPGGTAETADPAASPAGSSDATAAPAEATNGTAPHGPVDVCPHYHAAIELIGKRWTGAIVGALLERPLRFAELGDSVSGLSDRLLSERLKELEAAGIVKRTVQTGVPVRVTYALTPKGRELGPAVEALRAWARRHDCACAGRP